MKMLLTSAGFTNEEIFNACETLVGKKRQEIKIATIEEAHKVETGDMTWFNEEKRCLSDNFKSITTLPLQTQPLVKTEELIADADMIYCFGGNTTYLAKVLEETGFAKILPQLLAKKVWVGSSAGSCVLGHKESDQASKEIFQEEPYADHFLNIVPAVIFPHYHGWFNYGREDILRESKLSKYPIYVLSDQAAVRVTGDPGSFDFEFIGNDYLLASDGEIKTSSIYH